MGLRKSISSRMNRGLTATNLVLNGNFALSAGGVANSWTLTSTTLNSVVNNVQKFTANASGGNLRQSILTITGHKYYYSVYVKADSSLVRLNNGLALYPHSGSGIFERLRYIDTSSVNGFPHPGLYDDRASGWTEVSVQNSIFIDLTDLFGAGNEPSIGECDRLFANWFNGTRGLNQTLSVNSPLRN